MSRFAAAGEQASGKRGDHREGGDVAWQPGDHDGSMNHGTVPRFQTALTTAVPGSVDQSAPADQDAGKGWMA
ncbi:hypothetical protein GCM10010166_61750 [Couchioplanes caeruleus subsp. azureus]|nr:hypothetical protein GCM10010166_61750 [Couchioplanes caeruleus subsp. azureus]